MSKRVVVLSCLHCSVTARCQCPPVCLQTQPDRHSAERIIFSSALFFCPSCTLPFSFVHFEFKAHRGQKEFSNVLPCQQIETHTDCKNLTCQQFNTNNVMGSRLIIEEHGPTSKFSKGTHNIVAGALSRLDLTSAFSSEKSLNCFLEHFGLAKANLPTQTFPLTC